MNMLEFIPWEIIKNTAIQTFFIFWLTILILRFVSSRIFSQNSPEYLLFLFLLAAGMYSGIAGKYPSIWSSFTTAITLLITVIIMHRVHFLKRLITGNPKVIVKNSQLDVKEMNRTLIDVDDLNKMAREYGFRSYEAFESIILENDGKLTGIINFDKYEKTRFKKKE